MADQASPDNRIAIVGRAGRFPAARSVRDFWRLLDQGRVATTRLTEAQLMANGVSRRALADPNYVRASNILPDMESFDAPFFGFSPKEAAILDPQHRHFLETCWEALEDAGHVPERFDGRIGVYAGSGMQAYLPYNLLSNPALVEEIGLFLLRHTGNDKDFLPTRVSYLLNLTGPSMAIQTACSTSLVAVHVAANALLNMECDMALAGGVTIELPHYQGYRYAAGEILSPDGYCRAFDDDSQGTVFGSGAAVVVLRRMEDALADGDDIKAVILATAVNNDGSSKANYLAPSVEGQAEAAGEALALAGVPADSVTYVEAHGTGTPIGDPIELAALSQVYKGRAGSIGIGSVKTNIGHLDTAAGGASLIKVVEALRHRRIPPSLNFRKPNSRFDFGASPFRVVAERSEWPAPAGQPRRAAVNSLGVGGTNAHVIVEEAPARPAVPASTGWRLYPFAARDEAAIDRTRGAWTEFLAGDDVPDPADIAFTLREGRRAFPARMAVAARDAAQLGAVLGGSEPLLARTGSAADNAPEIVFMFPGGGAQYPGAGAELLEEVPAFAEAVRACFAVLPPGAPPDLHEIMFSCTLDDAAARAKMAKSSYAIPALFILEYAYAKLLEAWGIQPSAILAHSVGEYAGATIAGALDLADAMRIVTLRGQVMDAAPAGAMTTVPADEASVRALIGDELDIAAINAAGASVVSGTVEAITALEERLRGTEREAKRIQIDVAAHSRVLDGQLDRFRAGFEGVRFQAPKVRMVSSLRGGWGAGDDFVSADYWVRHLRHTVRFTDALAAVSDQPGRIVLEVGPGQTLTPLARMAGSAGRPLAVLPVAPKPTESAPEAGVALAAVGGLWAHGAALDWHRLPGGTAGRRVSIPTYAFDRTKHWIAPGRGLTEAEPAEDADAEATLARRADPADWIEEEVWEETPLSGAEARLAGRWLVFAGDDAISAATLTRLRSSPGADIVVVRVGEAFSVTDEGFRLRPDSAEDHEALLDALGGRLPERILHLWPLGAAPGFAPGFLVARALQTRDAGAGRRLVFAAKGTAGAPTGAPADPDCALLLGPVRVAPREIEGLSAALVDLPEDCGPDVIDALLAEGAARPAEDHVALRGSARLVPHRRRATGGGPDVLARRLRAGGVCLITGGTSGVGAALARWLAGRTGARLALLGRRGEASPGLVEEIGAAGGQAMVLGADVADPVALAAAVDLVRATWGTIDAVVHAAGVIADAPLMAKTLDQAHAVLRPKVEGGRNLDALFPEGTLDAFVVFSSSSVATAPAGQTDYVAANAWLEALARRRADGLAVAWGTWRGIGMAERSYGAGERDAPGPHPLLGPAERGAGGALAFTRRFDADADWVLGEHVVGGQPVLPGAAYFELARAAAATARPEGGPIDITAPSLSSPFAFAGGRTLRRMTVRLVPDGQGYEVRIESAASAGAAAEEHFSARLSFPAAGDIAVPDVLAKPLRNAEVAASGGEVAQTAHIRFGPRWASMREVRVLGDMAEGSFSLPEPFRPDIAEGYRLHPALLDMAMTVGLHGLPPEDRDGLVYAPISASRIRVLGPLPADVTARALRTRRDARRMVTFDVAIFGSGPNPAVLIEGLALRAIEGGRLGQGAGRSGPLIEQLLATGIGPDDAPALFERVFATAGPAVTASPVSLDLVRLASARVARAPAAVRDESGITAAMNPVEARLAAIWRDLLGVGDIGADQDFFALGGHSLNAVRMISRIRKEFGTDLPLAALFEAPTIAAIARRIGGPAIPEGGTQADPGVAIAPPVAKSIELTEGQREIYSGILIDPATSTGHNLCFSIDLTGPVDEAALAQALDALVLRHDALRARFDGAALRMETDPAVRVPLQRSDLAGLGEAEAASRLSASALDLAGPAFDLSAAPIMRARLVTLGADRHALLIAVHHIVCDGWSIGVVARELAELYSAQVERRAPRLGPAESIADFVAAEQTWETTDAARRHRDYWRDLYRGALPAMDLPTDHPRTGRRSTTAGRIDKSLPADLEAKIRDTAERLGSNLQTFLFAAFQTWLSRLVKTDEIVIGLPASGQVARGLEGVVGHCVNFLPLRARIRSDASFAETLAALRANLLDALEHQNFTYGALMRDLAVARDTSRLALVPVVVNIDNLADSADLRFGPAKGRLAVLPTGHANFELFLNILDMPGRVELYWTYNANLFEHETVARHAAQFEQLLRGLSDEPGIPVGGLGRLLAGPYRPASGIVEDPADIRGPQDIVAVFRGVASRFADREAVSHEGVTLDYAGLDARSDALAARLAALGIGRGDLVGITSARSLDLIVAVMGVLKAGAGYVPFDVSLPAERLAFMARDTGIRVLIGRSEAVEQAAEAEGRTLSVIPFGALPDRVAPGETVPAPEIGGEDVAYVMYTSGTTGVPKGVVLPHRSVIRLLVDADWLDLGPDTVTLHSSAFAFDTSIIDIFAALLHGGRVVVPKDGLLSIADLTAAVGSGGVNTLWLTSGLFHAVADLAPEAFHAVGQVIVGGDIVSPAHVAKVMEANPALRVINGYGPTESNVTNAHLITWDDIRAGQSLPIGQAIRGTQVYILDEAGLPVPPGTMGELAIAGRGLALGYWNRPELTAEKFVSAAWDPSLRLYRSGDLAMDPGNGVIRFFGRIDTQVKVRGFRVELGEVEAALESHAGVAQACAVAVVPEGQADKIIVAYVVARGTPPSRRALAEHVKTLLPAFARPSRYVFLDRLPLNANGKVDRRALPTAEAVAEQASAEGGVLSPTEAALRPIWVEVLGKQDVGVEADFFELGGHSLLAVKLFARIDRRFGVDLPISTLFQNPTIRDLAQVLDETGHGVVAQVPEVPATARTSPDEWDTTTVISTGPGTGTRAIFIVGGVGGNVNNLYELGREIGQTRPVIGLQTRGVMGHAMLPSIEAMAADHIRHIRGRQPKGPYLLAGYSGGALTAFEIARQLRAAGEAVSDLVILDTYAPGFAQDFRPAVQLRLRERLADERDMLRRQGVWYLAERTGHFLRAKVERGPVLGILKRLMPKEYRLRTMEIEWMAAARGYRGGITDCRIFLVRSEPLDRRHAAVLQQSPCFGWDKVTTSTVDLFDVPGDHKRMVVKAGARMIAEALARRYGV